MSKNSYLTTGSWLCDQRLHESPAGGYTGCPQQFFELDANDNEILDGMPNLYETYRYHNFVKMFNQLAEASSGLRMIGGLSGGGAIATAAMNTATTPDDRALFIAPWLHARGTFLQNVLMLFERFLPVGFGQTVPCGESCLTTRSHGRAGYCQTYIANLACAENFGLDTYFSLEPAKTKVQFVGVEDDPPVDNDTNSLAIGKMQLKSSAVCFMPKGVPNSFFPRFDNDNASMRPRHPTGLNEDQRSQDVDSCQQQNLQGIHLLQAGPPRD